MTRERLECLSDENLQELARREGLNQIEEMDREELLDEILEAMEEDRAERSSGNNLAMKIKGKKYDIILDEEIASQITAEYPLPEKYHETRIVLMLRDPSWAYTYWDIKPVDIDTLELAGATEDMFLRVYIRDMGAEKPRDHFDIPLRARDNSWYINLPEPGAEYIIDLLYRSGEKEICLCRSNPVFAPRSDLAEEMKSMDEPLAKVLMLSGLFDPGSEVDIEQNSQRITGLLDSQYLHLTN